VRILFLADNFPPETNAPAARTFDHTRVWARVGHAVTVVTCAPNFPTGRVHDGYRNALRSVETIDGVRVVRVWSYVAPNRGTVRRSLDYLSFSPGAVAAAVVERRPDVVVGTSPQFFTAVAANAAGALLRRPWVFELRDLWPASIRAVGAAGDGPAMRALEALERHLYRRAARIVCVTEPFRRVLAERGVDEGKIDVVPNGVDLEMFAGDSGDRSVVRRGLGIGDDEFLAAYVGTIGMAHRLETVLEAARLAAGSPVRFLIVGEGAERERIASAAAGLSNVILLRGQPRERVPALLAASDASLVLLRRSPLFKTVVPSKIFEAMAMRRPVVLGVEGESARIIQRTESGVAFEPESAPALLEAIERLRSDRSLAARLGENGRRAAEREFDRVASAHRMLESLAAAAE